VIDCLMDVLLLKIVVDDRLIGIDLRAGCDGSENFLLQCVPLDVRNNFRPNLTAFTVKHPNNRGLVRKAVLILADTLRANGFAMRFPLALMPVLRVAANKGLIYFNRGIRATKRAIISVGFHRLAYPMKHEPSRLLRDADRPRNLIAGDAIPAISEHPDDHHPLIQSDRAILEDRPNLQAELLLAAIALPNAARLDKGVTLGTTARARNQTARPTIVERKLKGTVFIGEVNDGGLKSLRGVHESNVRSFIACVKYVIANRPCTFTPSNLQ